MQGVIVSKVTICFFIEILMNKTLFTLIIQVWKTIPMLSLSWLAEVMIYPGVSGPIEGHARKQGPDSNNANVKNLKK